MQLKRTPDKPRKIRFSHRTDFRSEGTGITDECIHRISRGTPESYMGQQAREPKCVQIHRQIRKFAGKWTETYLNIETSAPLAVEYRLGRRQQANDRKQITNRERLGRREHWQRASSIER